MTKDIFQKSGLAALFLILINEISGRVTILYFQQPSGEMTGFIQDHNRMVMSIADWIFHFIAAFAVIFIYLRERKSGSKHTFKIIASMLAFFTIYRVIGITIGLFKVPNSFIISGSTVVYIIAATLVALTLTIMKGGIIAIPLIWIASNFKEKRKEIDTDKERQIGTNPSVTMNTIHPLASGAMIGMLSGSLFALCFILFPWLIGNYFMLFAVIPPVGTMYIEFSSFDIFIPAVFQKFSNYYGSMMAIFIILSLNIVISTLCSMLLTRSHKKSGLPFTLIIGSNTGMIYVAIYQITQHLVGGTEYARPILSSITAWVSGGLISGIFIALIRELKYFHREETFSAPISVRQGSLVLLASLLVLTMLAGEGIDINERRELEIFSQQRKEASKVRETTEGIYVNNHNGSWDKNGDFLIRGSITNSLNIIKPWSLEAKIYESGGNIIATAKVTNGKQFFTLRDTEILIKKRTLPYSAIDRQDRELIGKSTSNFEVRFVDPPPGIKKYALYVIPTDYNQIANDELSEMKRTLEDFYKNPGKLQDKKSNLNSDKEIDGKRLIDSQFFNVSIGIDWSPELTAAKKEEIIARREKGIEKYRWLGLYSSPYLPDESIFGQISEQTDWIYDTSLFIMNPYLLVIESAGEYVNGLFPYCPASSIVYSNNSITVRYDLASATKWLYYINDYYADSKGVVRLWFPNAQDAGYKYAHVDASKSLNIEAMPNTPNDHVIKGVYSPHDFFHVGRKGKNNISPNDDRAKLRLRNSKEKTLIFIKLWKYRPSSADMKEDFSYVIMVNPS